MSNHVVSIRINAKGYEDFLDSLFRYANRLYNKMVQYINEQEHNRVNSDEYKRLKDETTALKDLENQINLTSDKNQKKQLKDELKQRTAILKNDWITLNKSYNLLFGKFVNPATQYGPVSDLYQTLIKSYKIPSEVATSAITNAAQAYMKRKQNANGNLTLKFKPLRDLHSIQFRKSGFKLFNDGIQINKNRKSNVKFPFIFRSTDEERYLYALEREKVALVQITRRTTASGKRLYYANIIFSGTPYNYTTIGKPNTQVGIDVGVSKLTAYASDGSLKTFELSIGQEYKSQLSHLTQQMEWKRRIGNPQNYNSDGTIKSGKLTWNYSKAYLRLRDKFKELNYKITQKRKHHINHIVKELLSMGNNFYVENLDYSKMQEKKPLEEKSDGSGYKSRKNYGESLLYASPAMVIATLQEKLSYQNIELVKLSTFDTKLSQINHITGQYTKVSLSEKYRNINGFNINRRLYTAFLLSQFDGDLEFKNITTDNFTKMLPANNTIKDF